MVMRSTYNDGGRRSPIFYNHVPFMAVTLRFTNVCGGAARREGILTTHYSNIGVRLREVTK